MSEIRGMVLENSDPESWRHFPEAARRVWTFCERFGSDANPADLTRALRHHFAVDEPQMKAGIAVRGDVIVAHALAQIGAFYGAPYLEILQYEADEPVPMPVVSSVLGALMGWARFQWKAESVRIAARTPAVARLFRMKFGFETRQTLMRMPMPEVEVLHA